MEAENKNAGRQPGAIRNSDQHQTTARRAGMQAPIASPRRAPSLGSAEQIAAKLFPGPDPNDFARREAIAKLLAIGRGMETARRLLRQLGRTVWFDLVKLWVNETAAEASLARIERVCRQAANDSQYARELLKWTRIENDLRRLDELALERAERRAAARG
jgi:hypothetical protein